jgi:hypothetical protein
VNPRSHVLDCPCHECELRRHPPLTDQERLEKRYVGEWPAFVMPQSPSPSRVVQLFNKTSEGQWRWQVKVGGYRGVGYAPSLLAALGQAQDAIKAVAV